MHVSTRHLKKGEDKASAQILLVEIESNEKAGTKILTHPEVLDLLKSPAEIVSVMPDHFVQGEGDIYELLSIFKRFVRDVRG
tara:strand:- start:72 stop:317 length:246 start_codon:yes stop_codon:yes gene_type:complete